MKNLILAVSLTLLSFQVMAVDCTATITKTDLSQYDLDSNGSIDMADFGLLRGAFGSTVEPNTSGDFDGDGVVGFSDFGLFRKFFGVTAHFTTETTCK